MINIQSRKIKSLICIDHISIVCSGFGMRPYLKTFSCVNIIVFFKNLFFKPEVP